MTKRIRSLSGGGMAGDVRFGPGVFKKGYRTTANGWAQDISADEGEVLVKLSSGCAWTFAQYIVGDVDVILDFDRAGLV